jgi:hypothetical protein
VTNPSDDLSRAEALALLRAYCQRPGTAVLFDEPGGQLFDVFSTKTLPLNLGSLVRMEEKTNTQTKLPYLVLKYDDQRQVALTEVGIAFAPVLANTGALSDLPDVVCFRDYRSMLDRLKHELYGHEDVPPSRGTVKLLMMCIAVVDGARAQGFEVGREEKEMEHQLKELETRAPPPS